jgi:hypothetical protein
MNDAELSLSMRATSFMLPMVINRRNVLGAEAVPEIACIDIWSS